MFKKDRSISSNARFKRDIIYMIKICLINIVGSLGICTKCGKGFTVDSSQELVEKSSKNIRKLVCAWAIEK